VLHVDDEQRRLANDQIRHAINSLPLPGRPEPA
jgi:hypothetical protein